MIDQPQNLLIPGTLKKLNKFKLIKKLKGTLIFIATI